MLGGWASAEANWELGCCGPCVLVCHNNIKKKLIRGVAVGVYSCVNSVIDLRWSLVDVGINLVGS